MRLAMIGGGGHGSVVANIIEVLPEFTLVGILDSQLPAGSQVLGYEVLGSPVAIQAISLAHDIQGVIVAIGDNWTRAKLVNTIRDAVPTIQFPSVIHPAAQIGRNVRLGQGTVVMAGVVINCNSTVGEFCIVNTNSSLDHDTQLGDFVSFAPKSCTGGGTRIGNYSAICLGANIVDRITIGEHTVIGAGSTVLHDHPSCIIAYGIPARKITDRQPGDSYLS